MRQAAVTHLRASRGAESACVSDRDDDRDPGVSDGGSGAEGGEGGSPIRWTEPAAMRSRATPTTTIPPTSVRPLRSWRSKPTTLTQLAPWRSEEPGRRSRRRAAWSSSSRSPSANWSSSAFWPASNHGAARAGGEARRATQTRAKRRPRLGGREDMDRPLINDHAGLGLGEGPSESRGPRCRGRKRAIRGRPGRARSRSRLADHARAGPTEEEERRAAEDAEGAEGVEWKGEEERQRTLGDLGPGLWRVTIGQPLAISFTTSTLRRCARG